jgi:hypothetical protein
VIYRSIPFVPHFSLQCLYSDPTWDGSLFWWQVHMATIFPLPQQAISSMPTNYLVPVTCLTIIPLKSVCCHMQGVMWISGVQVLFALGGLSKLWHYSVHF